MNDLKFVKDYIIKMTPLQNYSANYLIFINVIFFALTSSKITWKIMKIKTIFFIHLCLSANENLDFFCCHQHIDYLF